jgi:hypothetical protein
MNTKLFFFTAAFAAIQVTKAVDTLLCPGSNGQTYTDACGATYAIECDTDHSGGNLPGTAPYVASLQACVALCSTTAKCIDVSWVKGSPNGACYLKSSVGTAKAAIGIWTGTQLSGCVAGDVPPASTTATSIITTSTRTIGAPPTLNTVQTTTANNDSPAGSQAVNSHLNTPEVIVGSTVTNANNQQTITAGSVGGAGVVATSGTATKNGNDAGAGSGTTASAVVISAAPSQVIQIVGGTTLSTSVLPTAGNKSWLSTNSGFETRISTLPGGSIVTVSSPLGITTGSATLSNITNTQNAKETSTSSRPASTSNTNEGNTSNGNHSGLSNGAYIGIGIGTGLFVIFLFGFLFYLRWHFNRRKGLRRGSIDSLSLGRRPRDTDVITTATSELADRSVATSELQSPNSTIALSNSLRSPVSPWAMRHDSDENSPTTYHEMSTEEPAEMVGSPLNINETSMEWPASIDIKDTPGSPLPRPAVNDNKAMVVEQNNFEPEHVDC